MWSVELWLLRIVVGCQVPVTLGLESDLQELKKEMQEVLQMELILDY